MLNRVKSLFESIVYAGMKPGGRPAQGAPATKQGWFARILSGPSQSDPLYLTNQTSGQKARRILLMVSPMIVVIAGGLIAIFVLSPKTTQAPRQVTVAELKAKVLPEYNQPIKLETNQDLEVTEVHFEHSGGNQIVGNLKNRSSHKIIEAVVVFDLADPDNSGLGGVTITELNLPPGSSRTFRKPIDQSNAIHAMVREVDSK